jgi:hypothetical protein
VSGFFGSVKQAARHLVLKPAIQLVDYSVWLAVAPRSFAHRRIHLGDPPNIRHGVRFFTLAISVAIVVERLAFLLLGVSSFGELSYWVTTLLMWLAFLSVLSVGLTPVAGFRFMNLMHISLFTTGASYFVASVLFLVAVGTVYLLKQIGYIPDFVVDPAAFGNYEQIGMQAYRECISRESVIINLIMNSDGSLGMLAPPFNRLDRVRIVVFCLYLIPFIGIVAALLRTRIVFAGAACFLTLAILVGGAIYGIIALDDHLYATTGCSKESVEVANTKTLEKRIELAVENYFGPRIGTGEWVKMTSVKIDGRSVLVHLVVQSADAEVHRADMDKMRAMIRHIYCTADEPPWQLFRDSNVSLVHIFRLPNEGHVGTFSVNRDECRT